MSLNGFQEFGLAQLSSNQSKYVRMLTEDSKMLASAPLIKSNNGFTHNYEVEAGIVALGDTKLDAPMTEVDAEFVSKNLQLSKKGGTMFVGQDKADSMGGVNSVITRKTRAVLEKTGNEIEKQMIYDNIAPFCVNNNKVFNAGGTGSSLNSIIAVTWDEDYTSMVTDVTANKSGENGMFRLQKLNGGEPTKNDKGIIGYEYSIDTKIGLLLSDAKKVSMISNINSTTISSDFGVHLQRLVQSARRNSKTVLYMHPDLEAILSGKLKENFLQLSNADRNLDLSLSAFNNVPIITSYQFEFNNEPARSGGISL